jgi:F-box/TPR repeat protein Pof3
MARMMTPEEYQEVGRRCYKLKQYGKAVEAFTQGINIAPTLSLFDHRAAAYDRLEDYNAAVKDGREMIKVDKKDVKGYLRTASVLEKMEKLEIALGIYKYGMKNVPVSDKNFKVHTWETPEACSHLTSSSFYNNCTTRPRASCLPQSLSIHLPSSHSNSQR